MSNNFPLYLQPCSIDGINFTRRLINAPAPYASPLPNLRDLAAHPVLGGVITKTCTLKPRGNVDAVNYECAADGSYSINWVGLANWGIEYYLKFQSTKPWIISIAADNIKELDETLRFIDNSSNQPSFVELNLSCPNTRSRVTLSKAAELITNWSDDLKFGLKVAPRQYAGEDYLRDFSYVACCNTLRGIGGKKLEPFTMEAIRYYSDLGMPVIAMGGVQGPKDAIKYLEAGATMVAAATAPLAHAKGALAFFDKFRDPVVTGPAPGPLSASL